MPGSLFCRRPQGTEDLRNLDNLMAATDQKTGPVDRLEGLAFEYGQSYDSYLVTEGRPCQFWSTDGSCALAYALIGRFVHVQGGLLGPKDRRPQLLREFAEFLRQNRYVATFYNIGEAELPHFKDQGFQITKWGEEPLLDLADLTWSGREYEWVRRQANYCRRHKLLVSECVPNDCSPTEWDEIVSQLQAIDRECLSTKPQRGHVRFFNGTITSSHWHRKRLFIARSDGGSGPIEGFVICHPFDGGRQWSIETYRHRLNAPRGLVAFMIHQVVDVMKREGIASISLCLCPGVRTTPLAGDSWVIRRCLQFGFHYASAFFDMPGEYHFKSRFRPRFVHRFICHWPHASVASMWSIVRMCGALEVDLNKLTRNTWQRLTRYKVRRDLAVPSANESSQLSVRETERSEKNTNVKMTLQR
jgi:phosphatidylglycerol lysyltransferase